ncbi:MAG: hypothetical protein ACREIV_14765, partial [Planctomycetaceae bacterium]
MRNWNGRRRHLRILSSFLLVLGCEAAPAQQPLSAADRQPATPHGDTITTAMRELLDRFRAPYRRRRRAP